MKLIDNESASVTQDIAIDSNELSIAVLIPCYNEEMAIAKVVNDFNKVLPSANIYVYDNNSNDKTVEQAELAGAIVRSESLQGKGNVVRRMFAEVDADCYILVDGDGTYEAADAPKFVKTLQANSLDMLNGARLQISNNAYRPGHRLGNRFLSFLVSKVFGNQIGDLLSGYRAFSRRFVQSFPAQSRGFEIETELTVHALELRMRVDELETRYSDRAKGTESKLKTYQDGLRILRTIFILIKEERPLQLFSIIAIALFLSSAIISIPIFTEYASTGLVPRFPTAILATGLMLLSFLSFACGLILDSVSRTRKEIKRMWYVNSGSRKFLADIENEL